MLQQTYNNTYFSVNKSLRLFITHLQINLVHDLQKKNKEQGFGQETHPHE